MAFRIAPAAAVAAAALLFVAGSRAEAGLAYVSQSRSVEVSSIGSPDARSAADFGPFDGAVSKERHSELGDIASARASQRSTLGADSIVASGDVTALSGSPEAHYRSLLDVTFDVAQPTSYSLDAFCGVDIHGLGGNLYPNIDLFTVLLRKADSPAGTFVVEHRVTDSDLFFNPPLQEVSSAGTLQSGRYELTLQLQASVYSGGEQGPYSLKFAVGDGGGSGPPSAVPLPPAGYAGLLALAGLAGGQWVLARRRRRLAAE